MKEYKPVVNNPLKKEMVNPKKLKNVALIDKMSP
jgi:hypothetical protein